MTKKMLFMSASVFFQQAVASTFFVNIDSSTPSAPYSSWETAATNIQDAVDAASSNDTVLVTNGVYDIGERIVVGVVPCRVAVDKAISVLSVNGPEETIIMGQGPNGAAAVRCVYLGSNAFLSGFTLTNGHTHTDGDLWDDESGGGIWCEDSAMVSNCVISGNNAASYAAGALYGQLDDCEITGNSGNRGSGATIATLNNCVLQGNYAANWAGGSYRGTLTRCMILDNSAGDDAGGVYDGVLNSCVLSGNVAGGAGGGAYNSQLTHCTVTGNTAEYGGGIYANGSGMDEVATNCIVWGNTATKWEDNWGYLCKLAYSCTTPLNPGSRNISSDPLLVSGSHLATNSPCIGAGVPTGGVGSDVDGESWRTPPSMGCDEVYAGASTGELFPELFASFTNVSVGFRVDLTGVIAGHAGRSVWDFDDGMGATNQPYTLHRWATAGTYNVSLTAYNDTYPAGVATSLVVTVQDQPVHYVNLNSAAPVVPYSSWATAATNIQDAIDSAEVTGALILVTNGVYKTGSRDNGDTMMNRIVVDKPVVVRSVNGRAKTIIEGQGPSGVDAVRCAYLADYAVLSGFTLTNGHARLSGGWATERAGGGAWMSGEAALTNCLLTGNSAYGYGGGSHGGTLVNCTVENNSSQRNGGGAAMAVLDDCLVINNSSESGGGGFNCTFSHCTVISNSAEYGGAAYSSGFNYCEVLNNYATEDAGGLFEGTMTHCMIIGNQAEDDAGGAFFSILNNCVVAENICASGGGGANKSDLYNCTVTGNTGGYQGGGVTWGTAYNTIIWGNTPLDVYYNNDTRNSCSPDIEHGVDGNITNSPALAFPEFGDYRLSYNSPCIDAGDNFYAGAETDLDGAARISNATVDMGAYEIMQSDWWIGKTTPVIKEQVAVGNACSPTTFGVYSAGPSNLVYSLSDDAAWMELSPTNGTSAGEQDDISILFDTAELSIGTYTAQVSIVSAEALNSPQTISVLLTVYEPQIDHFQWAAIDPAQAVDTPISVAVTAKDENGYDVPSFTGTVGLSAVVSGTATNVGIGNGAKSFDYPMYTYYHDSRTQVIYLQSEVGGNCSIESLALNVETIPSLPMNNWTIRMRHTTQDVYEEGAMQWEDDWTVVYQANSTVTSTGWVSYVLSTPFAYNGSDNLMIDFSHNNTDYDGTGVCLATDVGVTRTITCESDSDDGDPLDWMGEGPYINENTLIPNIRLGVIPGVPVSMTPATSGSFAGGTWSGSVVVQADAVGVLLLADDGSGHRGNSNPFNVASGISELDSDGDGMSDADELIAGTSSTDSNDYFRVTSVSNFPAAFTVYFQSLDTRQYELKGCSNLVDGMWFTVPGAELRMGVGGLDSMSDTNQNPASRFYQLEVSQP